MKGSAAHAVKLLLAQLKEHSYLQPQWEVKLCFQWELGQMEENHRQLTDWDTYRCIDTCETGQFSGKRWQK